MHILCAFHLLTIITTFASALPVDLFLNGDLDLPKCCPEDQVYNLVNNTLKCVEMPLYDLVVRTDMKNRLEVSDCVEVLASPNTGGKLLVLNGTDYAEPKEYTRYPKCCPLGRSYDTLEHKCVKDNVTTLSTKTRGFFVKYGLGHCVSPENCIVDYDSFTIGEGKEAVLPSGKRFELGKYCFDKDSRTGKDVLRACQFYEDACERSPGGRDMPCFVKCCPDGQSFVQNRCKFTFDRGLNVSELVNRNKNQFKDFVIIQANKGIKIRPQQSFKLDERGNFYNLESGAWKKYRSDKSAYCFEMTQDDTYEILIYYKEDEYSTDNIRAVTTPIMLVASCICLLLTIVSYTILPEMRNLYGKSVMTYCAVLLLAFTILACMIFFGIEDETACITVGFLIMFAFLGAFSWLNIICFDMWMAFGQMRMRNMHTKKSDCKRFMYYQLYGWGVPTCITLLTYAVYTTRIFPDKWTPHIGNGRCFFDKDKKNYDFLVYFLLPQTLLIACNCVLFIKTILYCFKVKDEINKMKDTVPNEKAKRKKVFNTDKEKLNMLVKLCVIMGIPWTFEVLVSFVPFNGNQFLAILELIGDTCNYLQGVFIFCIFILKKKVLTSLKNRVFGTLARRPSDSNTTMTSLYSTSQKNGTLPVVPNTAPK